jgi:hypothetical protein
MSTDLTVETVAPSRAATISTLLCPLGIIIDPTRRRDIATAAVAACDKLAVLAGGLAAVGQRPCCPSDDAAATNQKDWPFCVCQLSEQATDNPGFARASSLLHLERVLQCHLERVLQCHLERVLQWHLERVLQWHLERVLQL